jgi:hypothetical protein
MSQARPRCRKRGPDVASEAPKYQGGAKVSGAERIA